MHVCAYSTIRFTLGFVNLFLEVSRVWAMPPFNFADRKREQVQKKRTEEEKDNILEVRPPFDFWKFQLL